MLGDGRYSAWFRIPQKEGLGIITLAEGKLSGGDSVLSYSGSFEQQGDVFTATVSTRRHSDGQPSIFGIDEVEIELGGRSKTLTASCAGRARQRPDVPFEVVLVRIND